MIVGIHSGDAGYDRVHGRLGRVGRVKAFRRTRFSGILIGDRPISDMLAAMICHGLFDRAPRVRVATIESGSSWVDDLIRRRSQGLQADPEPLPRRSVGGVPAPSGSRPLRGRHSSSPTTSASTTCCWAPTGPTPRACPEPSDFIDDLEGFAATRSARSCTTTPGVARRLSRRAARAGLGRQAVRGEAGPGPAAPQDRPIRRSTPAAPGAPATSRMRSATPLGSFERSIGLQVVEALHGRERLDGSWPGSRPACRCRPPREQGTPPESVVAPFREHTRQVVDRRLGGAVRAPAGVRRPSGA